MESIQVYSEKLDAIITIDREFVDDCGCASCFDTFDDSSLVGWSHHGWNNAGGGGSW